MPLVEDSLVGMLRRICSSRVLVLTLFGKQEIEKKDGKEDAVIVQVGTNNLRMDDREEVRGTWLLGAAIWAPSNVIIFSFNTHYSKNDAKHVYFHWKILSLFGGWEGL